MTQSKQIMLTDNDGFNHSGIDITYIKSRNALSIGGWYDSCVGIPNREMSVPEFCEKLGITAKDMTRESKVFKWQE